MGAHGNAMDAVDCQEQVSSGALPYAESDPGSSVSPMTELRIELNELYERLGP